MIETYLNEFFYDPKKITSKKITYIKNYFYPEINDFKNIKRENFQVGVNNNHNLLFFRDKTNKHDEIILHLVTNKKFNNFRKEISFTINASNSFDMLPKNQKSFIINDTKENLIDNKNINQQESIFYDKCICLIS